MSMSVRRQRRCARVSPALLLIVVASLAVTGCSDDDEVTAPSAGPFQLTFSLDASYQRPHGGQSINIAVLRSSDGVMVAGGDGLVSADQDPSFSFAAGPVLEAETAYEVHYWIDSNFGGGTPGACDAQGVDHQWNVAIPAASGDVARTESHDPSMLDDVCSTFG
jgi:hypothetical protein